jgi:hypothetical protein
MVMAWAAVEGWIFGIVLILFRKREEIWSCGGQYCREYEPLLSQTRKSPGNPRAKREEGVFFFLVFLVYVSIL